MLLEAGAVDYIQKPSAGEIEAVSPFILLKVKTAARASIQKATIKSASRIRVDGAGFNPGKIVAIGSSTGGTEALKEIFIRLPEKIPPIVVVQQYTGRFFQSLRRPYE